MAIPQNTVYLTFQVGLRTLFQGGMRQGMNGCSVASPTFIYFIEMRFIPHLTIKECFHSNLNALLII